MGFTVLEKGRFGNQMSLKGIVRLRLHKDGTVNVVIARDVLEAAHLALTRRCRIYLGENESAGQIAICPTGDSDASGYMLNRSSKAAAGQISLSRTHFGIAKNTAPASINCQWHTRDNPFSLIVDLRPALEQLEKRSA